MPKAGDYGVLHARQKAAWGNAVFQYEAVSGGAPVLGLTGNRKTMPVNYATDGEGQATDVVETLGFWTTDLPAGVSVEIGSVATFDNGDRRVIAENLDQDGFGFVRVRLHEAPAA